MIYKSQLFKSYLHRVTNNKRVYEKIGATNWSIKRSLICQTLSMGTGHWR